MEPKLLVVDDDVHIRKLLRLTLRKSGYQIEEAATGEEAMKLAESDRFDLVLLDLILPYYGGFRLCQRFKATHEPPYVIVMTADDSPETRATAKECGADDFLAKPFSPTEVAAKIEALRVIGNRQ